MEEEIILDKHRRNSFIEMRFHGKDKDEHQFNFAMELEKLGIPYSGGIEYDPDVIMVSAIHYIQLKAIIPDIIQGLLIKSVYIRHLILINTDGEEELVPTNLDINNFFAEQDYIGCQVSLLYEYRVYLENRISDTAVRADYTSSYPLITIPASSLPLNIFNFFELLDLVNPLHHDNDKL
jgi:hypothetical protein